MTVNGVNDGSWELQIFITDLQVERKLRVRGDLHIGGLMLRLAESLEISNDWSDHGLWWPAKNVWLLRTRSTLDQYGVQSDCLLHFTPMHKTLNMVLPDLQCFPLKINFAVNVFSVIVKLCKEIGIKHPEELSLFRMLTMEDLRKNKGISATRRAQFPHAITHNANTSYDSGTMASPFRNSGAITPQGTLKPGSSSFSSPGINTIRYSPNYTNGHTILPGSANSLNYECNGQELCLENSPQPAEPWLYILRPRNYAEKARINAGWLDSSRSLFEQNIVENDIVCLKFKFYSFYDLNPKTDLVRINQLYQQARWALISEEIDCTEEEMIMFAALQLQINHQCTLPQPDISNEGEDEIDAALNELQTTLEGTNMNNANDIMHTPELKAYLKYTKKKNLKTFFYKKYYFVFKEIYLTMYKHNDDKEYLKKFNLKGSEVNADVDVESRHFVIKLYIPSHTGLSEVWLKLDSVQQYSLWMAGFRLAARGHTMADAAYKIEVDTIQSFLESYKPSMNRKNLSNTSKNLELNLLMAPRFLNRLKSHSQISQRILDTQTNFCHLNLVDAKLNFIKVWQSLQEFGLTYFITKFNGSKKEELLAVAYNRMIKMDLSKGSSLKTWSFQHMKSWSVNWETKTVQVIFEDENVMFQCLTADCKVVHEFIGGYIFLSMRSADKNQALNEESFHELTGGRD